MARTLANAQMTIVAMKPRAASPGSNNTYLGNIGAQKVADILPTTKPITPSPSACYRIMLEMVRLRVPISFRTAISRILPKVRV